MFGFKKKRSQSDEKPESLALDKTTEVVEAPITEDLSPPSVDVEQPDNTLSSREPAEDDASAENTRQASPHPPTTLKKPQRNLFGFLKKKPPEPEEVVPPTKIPPVEKSVPERIQPGYLKIKHAREEALEVDESDTEVMNQPTTEALSPPPPTEEPLEADAPLSESPVDTQEFTVDIPHEQSPLKSQQSDDKEDLSEESLDSAIAPTLEAISGLEEDKTLSAPHIELDIETSSDLDTEDEQSEEETAEEKQGFFRRLRSGLSKTSSNITGGMSDLVLGKREIDDELFEELETRLLMADVGIETTTQIISTLNKRVKRKNMTDSSALYEALADAMQETLEPCNVPLIIDQSKQPFVILVIGVNGAGKTTTIGKLARNFQEGGFSVMLAAGDTFRAAAVEQLTVWGERNEIPVIAQGTGADSASVIFDALQAAKARNIDILIADTAGRLHTQDNLMEELKKVKRVLGKIDDSAPHETLLVLDGGTGQNALKQGETFNESIGVTGLAITKLDGTAKGGVLFAMANKLGIPIRYIGVGEGIEDLRVFDSKDFVQALIMPQEDHAET